MKTILQFTLLCFLSNTLIFSQEKPNNLDFEIIKNNKPINWKDFGNKDYTIFIDSTVSQKGKNSAVIEYDGDSPEFKAWAYTIPAKYQGKKIKLTGYIKTENVSDGYAGLWLRINPSVGFDNMKNRGVKGTTDWKKYIIELDLKPSEASLIVFGGLLVGKGKMWIDNLEITIDGKTLEKAKPKALSIADKDNEFDKNSNIKIENLDKDAIANLELLGKVWGFLKYHHPAIAKGNYNWDYELFRILPKYLSSINSDERDKLLLKWIDGLGKIEKCKSCKETPKDAYLKPDHNWIDSFGLSENLKQKLHFIYQNRNQGKNYYIAMAKGVGNPEFKHEKPYSNMPFPDDGFRLLSLYRYWNMIQYYFPNRHLMDKNWNTVLREYIPRFVNAKDELEYELTVLQIIADIQDTHANIWGGGNKISKWKGEFYAPVHVRFIEDQLVVTNYYNPELKDKVGLEIGDVITKINGKTIDDIIKEKKPFYPASNYPTQLRNISGDILRSTSNSISITYIGDSKELTKDLQLYKRKDLNIFQWYPPLKDDKSYKLLDKNIGYITLQNIKEEDIPEIRNQFIDTKGIIVDIRNYPSTFVPFLLGSFFISKFAPFVTFTNGNVNNPGEFTFGKLLKIPSKHKTYKGKVVVIVNELTQSSAEYTTMAFRAGENTTVIGSTTAGADGNVSSILLPGNIRTMISGKGVFYPDKTQTQRVGIIPDVEVKPTIDGIKNGKDEPLEKAIELILK